ncbi:iron chelate uptake ABC transporter family permease subunit [Microbacterium sp. NPDC089695]|uniref:iron chelate uptake ABC transporter family permease subunit n=1 Tax=Microbacterium sp. NPDC089695 TaxID=3364198 RepID=UPI003802DA1B
MSADIRVAARDVIRRARRPLDRRGRIAMTLLVVALLASFLASLSIGDTVLSPFRVVQALFETRGGVRMVVVDWRMPRALAAVVFGAALAWCSRPSPATRWAVPM